jgi:hypothetical protein
MKKVIYGTLAVFFAILILTIVIAQRTPIHEVKYENGLVVPKSR